MFENHLKSSGLKIVNGFLTEDSAVPEEISPVRQNTPFLRQTYRINAADILESSMATADEGQKILSTENLPEEVHHTATRTNTENVFTTSDTEIRNVTEVFALVDVETDYDSYYGGCDCKFVPERKTKLPRTTKAPKVSASKNKFLNVTVLAIFKMKNEGYYLECYCILPQPAVAEVPIPKTTTKYVVIKEQVTVTQHVTVTQQITPTATLEEEEMFTVEVY